MTPADQLERSQWDLFWLPPDATTVDRPDLLLVSCPRPVAYLNGVLRTRTSDAPALVAEVSARNPRARWMVTDTHDRRPLEAALGAAGWSAGVRHEVRVLPVEAWRRDHTVEVRQVVDLATLRDCVSVADRGFGGTGAVDETSLDLDLRACTVGTRVRRFVAYLDGVPVASGGLTAFPELKFGLLWAGATVPEARGRGAYAAVLGARVEMARRMGLGTVGLYAVEDTSAPIVARHGFRMEGEMWFWARGSAGR